MASTQNNFNKGLNSDIVKTQFNAQQYVKALNMRLTNSEELTTGSLNNIKGNKSFPGMEFPLQLYSAYKIENILDNNSPTVSTTIDINGNSVVLTVGGSTTGEDIKTAISTLPGYNTTFTVYTYENLCVVKGLTQDPVVLVTPNTALTLTQWANHIDLTTSQLTVIGSTYINSDIYLITTTIDDEPGGDGQIWKFTYDETLLSYNPIVTLIYHSTELRLCKQHAIFNECKGNYENINIQKIYWTDEYNPLRGLNVADPNAFAIPTNIINSQPDASLPTLKLKEILDTGSIIPGYYMFTYRYGNVSGATTPFAAVTPAIPIIISPESNSQLNYVPFPTSSAAINKSIVLTSDQINSNFSYIEAAYIFYSPGATTPEVRLFRREFITGTSIDITLSDFYSGEALTLQDLNVSNISFDTIGTIEIKDNRLAVGRVKLSNANDLNYDFRAYRFPHKRYDGQLPSTYFNWNGTTWDKCMLKDVQGNKSFFDTTIPDNWGVTETEDAITPRQAGYDVISYNSLTEGATDPNLTPLSFPTTITEDKVNYKYQSNGNTIGGSGPNVSYTFFNQDNINEDFALIGDSLISTTNTRGEYSPTVTAPYYELNGNKYPWKRNNNYSRAYAYQRLNGFQYEETYRFAAEIVDKQGNVLFTKWIGDIKFPSVTEIQDMSGGSIQYQYFNHTSEASNKQHIRPLGIKFEFNNLDTISDAVGSIRIVYVKREDIDKTIISSGIIFPYEDTLPASKYLLYSNPINKNKVSLDSPDLMYDYLKSLPSADVDTITPDYQFHKSNDTLLVIGRLRQSNAIPIGSIIKNYTYLPTFSDTTLTRQEIKISQATYRTKLNNAAYSTTGSNTGASENVTMSVELSLTDNYTKSTTPGYGLSTTMTHGDVRDDYAPLMVLYKRDNIFQYGGQGYSSRVNNTYKHTGFEIILSKNSPAQVILFTLGGDVCYPVWDYKKATTTPSTPISSVQYAVPLPLVVNTELRNINHPFYGILADNAFDSLDIPEYYVDQSNTEDPNPAIPEPFGFDQPTEFDQRVYISELKYPGEFGESWGIFKSSNYRDLDGLYGPLRKLINWQDQLIFLQDLAVGILPVNPRAFQTDATAATIITGSGEILAKHVYKTTHSGTRHQHSVLATPSGIYYYDKNQRTITLFNGQVNPISLLAGLQSWSRKNLNGAINTNDNSIWINTTFGSQVGITSTYDYKYGQVLFTFHTAEEDPLNIGQYIYSKFTVAYNDRFKLYESFYSFLPKYYISNNEKYFTQSPTSATGNGALYLHNEGDYNRFYNQYYPSEVEFLVNPNPNLTKTYDNLYIQSECYNPTTGLDEPFDTFTELTCYTDYQQTLVEPLTPGSTIKRRERSWFTRVPRDLNIPAYTSLKPRLRDKYMKVKLSYSKPLNDYNRLIFHNCLTDFRISAH